MKTVYKDIKKKTASELIYYYFWINFTYWCPKP